MISEKMIYVIFESYTTTVTSKLRCYTNNDRAEAPDDSNDFLNG